MSVPKFYEFFGSFLRAISDGEIHKSKDLQKVIAADMNLSAEDMAEQLPSQRQPTYYNRILWAKTYLDKAGLVETVARGQYRITDEGKKALASGETIDVNFLERYESFRKFQRGDDSTTLGPLPPPTQQQEEEEKTPPEIMKAAYDKINASLADDLMKMVLKMDPYAFEGLVLRLLKNMGYGSDIEDSGQKTQQTADGGIDGIVREDRLGFNNIYIQAKKWAPDNKVRRPELQKFAGALQGVRATKGLFITTSSFTQEAETYAANLLNSSIVLIDGKKLAKYMIDFNLGVTVEHTYDIKRIDTDFFNGDL